MESTRDVSALYMQYLPLRKATYQTYVHNLNDKGEREELISFIDEQFVRLCYEYDVSSEMDFAGYIKIMLDLRVKYSFMSSTYRVRNHNQLGKTKDVKEIFSTIKAEEEDGSVLTDFLHSVDQEKSFGDLEKTIIRLLVKGYSAKEVRNIILKDYKDIAKNEDGETLAPVTLRNKISEVKDFVRFHIKEWLYS